MSVRHPDPVALVRGWYERMNAGDIAGAIAALAPDVEWVEAEHSPYGRPGEPLVGAAAIGAEVWAPLARDWAEIRVVPEEYVPIPSGVLVTGRYAGTHRSGARLDAEVAHLWHVEDGRITRYRGFADTYALRAATA